MANFVKRFLEINKLIKKINKNLHNKMQLLLTTSFLLKVSPKEVALESIPNKLKKSRIYNTKIIAIFFFFILSSALPYPSFFIFLILFLTSRHTTNHISL